MKTGKKKTDVDQQIDENLRRVFDDALNQDVPDKFMDLIRQLKDSEGQSDPKTVRKGGK
jgi:hypothetical protein